MKAAELKLRLLSGVNNLIDSYFGSGSISDNMINATLKLLVRQNEYKVDGIIDMFKDEKGEIDGDVVVEEYSKVFGNEGIIIDIKDFVKSSTIRSFLPDKCLKVTQDDLKKIILS
jgi:phosphatidylinositol kinase/protein kinase (PI-3  family)